ncbi:GlsB/YeaQ/YmgE family stress response membrane protein [Tahibacter caeni]|uniref:GlsB/YeaQ/YmgE family stress response membrane protein n=1 Tax=Tahibacter caeni TaxID=1453545 RepID=UPI002147AE8B|nr:GlsB/YeaQ/YmgE family stress response membrane protein [Tahibacter caeni]
MMYWIGMFIAGLIIGVIAKLLMPGKDPGGFFVTGLIGVAGMFVGGFLSSMIFGTPTTGFQPSGYIGGIIGALILLGLYRVATRSRAS